MTSKLFGITLQPCEWQSTKPPEGQLTKTKPPEGQLTQSKPPEGQLTKKKRPEGQLTKTQPPEGQLTKSKHSPAPSVAPLSRSANTGCGTVSNERGKVEEHAVRTVTSESSATCWSAAQRQMQSFQQNVTHVHGDMIAQQNNIDVKLVEQNVRNSS